MRSRSHLKKIRSWIGAAWGKKQEPELELANKNRTAKNYATQLPSPVIHEHIVYIPTTAPSSSRRARSNL